jgi:hypothetical protein
MPLPMHIQQFKYYIMTTNQSSIFILFGHFDNEDATLLGAYTSRDGAELALADYKNELEAGRCLVTGVHGSDYNAYYIQRLVIDVPVGNI